MSSLSRISLLAFTLAIVMSSSLAARPSKYKTWRCQYNCMTDFDMCISAIKTIEEYIICHNAQGICKWHCLDKKEAHVTTAKKLKEVATKLKIEKAKKSFQSEPSTTQSQNEYKEMNRPTTANKKVIPTKKY